MPDGAGEVDDAARLVGDDGRIGEVELGLVALGLGLREVRLGARALRLQRVDLPLSHFERRLRALDRGLLGLESLDVNRALLSRRPTLIDERLVASPGDLREFEVRLRLVHLRLTGGDLRVLRGDLRVDALDAGFRPRHLPLGLGEGVAIIALVDLSDHVAFVDMLVVGDRNRRDVARDFGRDGELARRDEGVVGRLEMRGMIPIEVSGRRRQKQRHQAERRQDRMPAEPAPARALAGLFLLRGRLAAAFGFLLGGLRRALGLLVRLCSAAPIAGGVSRAGARKEMMSRIGPADDEPRARPADPRPNGNRTRARPLTSAGLGPDPCAPRPELPCVGPPEA